MTAMTRGPLPARVYWTRRILVIAVVTALVVGMVQLVALVVGAGSPSEPEQAAPVAAEVSSTPTSEPVVDDIDEPRQRDRDRKKDREPVLTAPEGECVDRDIAVTPTVEDAVGGSPIVFVMGLRTIQSPACTWEVSPQTMSVKITSGDDDIWFSSECPRSIPAQDVVLRNTVTTEVEVTWSSKRSDEGCTKFTDWAMPGWYHVEAAALAGEPSDVQFRLTAPDPDVVTETVEPEPKDRDGKKRDQERDAEEKKRD